MSTGKVPTWEERNAAYLALSLRWLRLRLHRYIDLQEQRVQTPEATRERASVAASRAAAARSAPAPALVALAQRLELSSFERDTVLLAAAPDLDPGIGMLIAKASQNPAFANPRPLLALLLLPRPRFEAFAPGAALRRERLIDLLLVPTGDLITAPMRAGVGVVEFLKGGG